MPRSALADGSTESIFEAVGRYHRANASETTGLQRIDEALAAAKRPLQPAHRSVIEPFVGPDHVIKTMEEFEAIRFMRPDDLTAEQITAMRTIREALGGVSSGTSVAKVVPLTGSYNAIDMIQSGNPNLAGSFARRSDLHGAETTPQLIDRLRLDSPPYHFQSGSPHAILETTADPIIANNAKVPLSGGFEGGSWDDPTPPNWAFPHTRNGLTASRDGRIVPEFRTEGGNPVAMPAGLDDTPGTSTNARRPTPSPPTSWNSMSSG